LLQFGNLNFLVHLQENLKFLSKKTGCEMND